jgi:hypothetical protein
MSVSHIYRAFPGNFLDALLTWVAPLPSTSERTCLPAPKTGPRSQPSPSNYSTHTRIFSGHGPSIEAMHGKNNLGFQVPRAGEPAPALHYSCPRTTVTSCLLQVSIHLFFFFFFLFICFFFFYYSYVHTRLGSFLPPAPPPPSPPNPFNTQQKLFCPYF